MRTPEEIGKIVRKLRGEMSLREFAELCGVSHSTIDNIEKGFDFRTKKPTNPSAVVLSKIAAAANVSLDFILGDDGLNLETLGVRPIKRKRFRSIGEIACGKPIFANEDYESYVDASADIDADFCLTAKGDSMIGARIYDGDIVFIKQMPIVPNGDIAAVIIGDEATLKVWHYSQEEQKLVLTPENRRYAPLVYTGSELNQVVCLGKAVCFMSNL